MAKKLTIAICTYNRADLIENAITSLMNQTTSNSEYDVLVVDNNSTDNTTQIVRDLTHKYPNLRVVLEQNLGLSTSRNTAVSNSDSNYIAYLDDDSQVESDYIAKVINIIDEHNPKIFGGPIYPFYVTPKPEWFKDEYEVRRHFKSSGWHKSGTLSGSNMIFAREVFDSVGGFNTEIGMRGAYVGFNDDTEFITRCLKHGYQIYYDMDLIVEHLVPQSKLNIMSITARKFINGRSVADSSPRPVLFDYDHAVDRLSQSVLDMTDASEEWLEKMRTHDLNDVPETYLIENILSSVYTLSASAQKLHEYQQRRSLLDRILDFNLRKLLLRIRSLLR